MTNERSWVRRGIRAGVVTSVALAAGCGSVVRDGRSPSQLVVVSLEAASGVTPDKMGTFLNSDVVTTVKRTEGSTTTRVPTIFNDPGRVTLRLQLRDPGPPGVPSSPSPVNSVTISRYHVKFKRTDGLAREGEDVPYAFDGAITITVSGAADASAGFELVRHAAKEESPLLGLATSPRFISTIAEITFYGHDQAGNVVSAMGSMSVNFGNYGDPE